MSYSSSVGRFLERDPIGYSEDGLNLYQAYRSNPVTLRDPLGLQATQPTTQPHDPGKTCGCGPNDINDDKSAKDDSNWLGEVFGTTAPNCDIWANPGYGHLVASIFGAGEELGYKAKDGWATNATDSGGPWTQAGAVKIKAALEKYLSRPRTGEKEPKGFVLDDCNKDCPCGYFKSAFFIRPRLSDYHFHHYSCRKKVWTEKEGAKNPPATISQNPLQDSLNGYLVACYCLKGSERHTPDEL